MTKSDKNLSWCFIINCIDNKSGFYSNTYLILTTYIIALTYDLRTLANIPKECVKRLSFQTLFISSFRCTLLKTNT